MRPLVYGWPILVGALLRIGWFLVHPHQPFVDELHYHQIAVTLVQSGTYRDLLWPPGWPFTLSVLYTVFGSQVVVGLVFNTLISCLTIGLIGWIAYRLFDPHIAWASMWLIAGMPSYILVNTLLMYEVWLQFLLIWSVIVAIQPRWRVAHVVQISVLTALISLMRPFWLLLPCLLWIMHHALAPAQARFGPCASGHALRAIDPEPRAGDPADYTVGACDESRGR
ncbi:MAG: hypothetical protein HC822_01050 [Oscillochloris sp.]|nr:hypothetical protein [Oscillochloris sp.]